MKIHDFLDSKEIARLQSIILNETSLFRGEDSEFREDWLNTAGINFPGLSTSGDKTKFLTHLFGLLANQNLSRGGEPRLGIIVLLEHMVSYETVITKRLSHESAEFLSYAIGKYETCCSNASRTSRQVAALAALTAQRKRLNSAIPNRIYRFDTDLILNSDLKKQINEFTNILQLDGIFPFTLGGRFEVLDKYIVKRIEQTIKNTDDRPIKRADVNLYAKNCSETLNGYQIIEQQIKEYYHCDRLTDLFDEVQRIDVLLIVWNYDVPHPEVKQIAESFWGVAQPRLSSMVLGQSRRFIVLWINIDSEPLSLPMFYALPPLECFEVEEIVSYFRDRLLKYNVENNHVEYFLAQLRRHQGQLLGTFQEMYRLVESFTGGAAV